MMNRNLHAQRGSTMVEFAITFMLMLMMLFGIFEFSLAMYDYHTVADAARMGARWAAVQGSDGVACQGASKTCPVPEADVESYTKTLLPLIDSADPNLAVHASWLDTATHSVDCSATQIESICSVVVKVTYTFNWPFSSIVPISANLTSTSTLPLQ